jgi:hypothetical protein
VTGHERRRSLCTKKFEARRDELLRTAQSRQCLFMPEPGDIGRALIHCFAVVTGSKEDALELTDDGDGLVTTRYRVDMNEYAHGAALLLPGDVLMSYSSRDDVVAEPQCELSMVAATPEVAATARQWLVDAGAPLLGLVITTQQQHPPPELSECWTSHGWSITVSSRRPRADRDPIHQIFVPYHDVGPWLGRETENESDHPDAVKLIAALSKDLVGVPPSSSIGDFRFESRSDFDRVCAALREHMLARRPPTLA